MSSTLQLENIPPFELTNSYKPKINNRTSPMRRGASIQPGIIYSKSPLKGTDVNIKTREDERSTYIKSCLSELELRNQMIIKERELQQIKNSKIEVEIENDSLKKKIPRIERMLEDYKLRCMELSAKLKETEDKAKLQAGQLNTMDEIALKICNSRVQKHKDQENNEKEEIIGKCEKAIKERDKEIKSLREKLNDLSVNTVQRLKAEVQRLSKHTEELEQSKDQLKQQLDEIKENEKSCVHIDELKKAQDKETDLNEKVRVLQIINRESEESVKRLKEESQHKVEKIEEDTKTKQSSLVREMKGLSIEVGTMSKIVDSVIKGEEPSFKAMMGCEDDTDKSYSASKPLVEECKEMKATMKLVRKKITNYFTEKYTSDCNVQ